MHIPFTDIILTGHSLKALLEPLPFVVLSLVIGFSLNRLLRHRLLLAQRRHDSDFLTIFIAATKGLPVIISFCLGLYLMVHSLSLHPRIEDAMTQILFAVATLATFRVIARSCSAMADARMAQDDNNHANTLLKTIFSFIIYSIGIVVILGHFGISVAPFLTAIGVGGMAVALGLQETLANIFAGLQLILSRQVRIGDYIRLSPTEEGCVTDITWRFTSILTATNNLVVVPNQKIASAVLTNYSRPVQDVTVLLGVGVAYDSDLEQVEQVTLEVARTVMQEVDGNLVAEPAVRFHTFGESSIDFSVVLHTTLFTNQAILKHKFIKALTARYRKENISIPFPVRTLSTDRPLEVIHKQN